MPETEQATEQSLAHKAAIAKSWLTMEDDGRIQKNAQLHECPNWVRKLVLAVHNGGQYLPDDYRYRFLWDALVILREQEPPEFEVMPDEKTTDLLHWAQSHARRRARFDEEIRNVQKLDMDTTAGLNEVLALSQAKEREAVLNRAREVLEDLDVRDMEPYRAS